MGYISPVQAIASPQHERVQSALHSVVFHINTPNSVTVYCYNNNEYLFR